VGAIQARANIRLRRLTDLADSALIEKDEVWRENLQRMSKDYIAPREIDAEWADVFILAAPNECTTEMERYLQSVRGISGKPAAVFGPIADYAAQAGLSVVPDRESDATAYGRRAAELARERKLAG
jgi:hypothetical protein